MGYISKFQLFTLVLISVVGGTTVYFVGAAAKKDAWIAILVAMVIGTVWLWIYVMLQNLYPDNNLAEIIINVTGKAVGIPLVFLYVMHFIFECCRVTRDYGELVKSTFLEKTPLSIVFVLFMIVMSYLVFLGYEVMARTSELLTPVTILFIVSIYVMVILSGKVNTSELKPVLAEGFGPVIKAVFPVLLQFPFAETMLPFLMFWKYFHERQKIFKICFLAFIVSTLIMIFSSIIIITTLGIDFASTMIMPLIEVVRLINIANIITNLDVIGIFVLLIGGFYKALIFFMGAIFLFATLFKIKNYRVLIIPFAVFVAWYSVYFVNNYPYHIWQGLFITNYLMHTIYVLTIPILLLLIGLLKKNRTKKRQIS